MIELAVDRGYEHVAVRDLATVAKVSTRAFYEHFGSKEECFLRTYDLIVQRMVGHLGTAAEQRVDWQDGVRDVIEALTRELGRDPRAARFVLIEGYAAGPAALKQVQRMMRVFEARIAESLGEESTKVPPLIVTGTVAGMLWIARSWLLQNKGTELAELGSELAEWALSCFRKSSGVVGLDRSHLQLTTPKDSSGKAEQRDQGPANRTLLLTAVAKLAAADGFHSLTAKRILNASGAPRRSFLTNFDSVTDCFIAAVEQQAGEALGESERAASVARDWDDKLRLAVQSICARAASDPVFAQLCFKEVLVTGAEGIECSGRLTEKILKNIHQHVPSSVANEPAQEASVGAIFGVLSHLVVTDRAWQAPQSAPMLAFLLLAPMLGAEGSELVQKIDFIL